jgi:hypothetical protein
MPLRTIPIRFSDPEIPFEVASELLSYIAHPIEAARQRRLAHALCRLEHRQETLRNPEWRSTPQLIRPHMFFQQMPDQYIKKDICRLLERVVAATGMLLPHLLSYQVNEAPLNIFGSAPTATNIARHMVQFKGGSENSQSTFSSTVWGPTKPVAHLAISYWEYVFMERWSQDDKLAQKHPVDIISPYPDNKTAVNIIENAERIRCILPRLRPHFKFSDDKIIRFVIATN